MTNIDPSLLLYPFLLTLIAGLSTAIGGLIFIIFPNLEKKHLIFCLGLSAGAMIYVSFVELIRLSIEVIGFAYANLSFFTGIILMILVDFMVPHRYLSEIDGLTAEQTKLYKTGLLVAFGIAIHNFPEGLAVFLSGFTDINLAISLALAIAVHNIPEGIAISAPVYYSTQSKSRAFWTATLSGLAEPLGGLIGFLLLYRYLSDSMIAVLYAIVAGIMVFISFDELLPQMYKENYHHHAIIGLLVGFSLMAVSLGVIN